MRWLADHRRPEPQVLPLPGIGCGGTIESCRRQHDRRALGGAPGSCHFRQLDLSWQLTHLPVSELPWPGAGGSG
jgi:hypothetical protein